ncbi:hypothetical protein SKPI104516_19505 [Skermania piniformis]
MESPRFRSRVAIPRYELPLASPELAQSPLPEPPLPVDSAELPKLPSGIPTAAMTSITAFRPRAALPVPRYALPVAAESGAELPDMIAGVWFDIWVLPVPTAPNAVELPLFSTSATARAP